MPKTDIRVSELVDMVRRGELRLPEMQRRYVWPATRVRDLLDSLYREYPSGSILVWETDQEQPSRDLAVSQEVSPFHGRKLLLDGQQRLTSLSAVIRGEPAFVRGRKKPIEILFNLDHPEAVEEVSEVQDDEEALGADTDAEIVAPEEEDDDPTLPARLRQRTFVVSNKVLESSPSWVRVSDVFRTDNDWELLKARVTGPDDPKYPLYTLRLQKLRRIRDYQYQMQVLDRSLSYEEVAEIFVRVNSLGVKLRGSDLALAQVTARWHNSLQLFEAFQSECENRWFNFDIGLLIRAMVVFATRQSKFHTVGTVPVPTLQAGWERAKEGLRFAINFLHSNAGIENESLLSSPLLLLPLAVIGMEWKGRLAAEEERSLLHWLYVANARGHYSRGSTETILDADLNILFRQADVNRLVDPLRQQFGRLTVEPGDFEGRNIYSPLASTAFLALRCLGAQDWQSGLVISLSHQGRSHLIEAHHIFPKSLLHKAGFESRHTNEIANMAFVGGATNRWISNKPPAEYLRQVISQRGESELQRHAIPLDPALWTLDRYEEFLAYRRGALADAVNQLFRTALEGETAERSSGVLPVGLDGTRKLPMAVAE